MEILVDPKPPARGRVCKRGSYWSASCSRCTFATFYLTHSEAVSGVDRHCRRNCWPRESYWPMITWPTVLQHCWLCGQLGCLRCTRIISTNKSITEMGSMDRKYEITGDCSAAIAALAELNAEMDKWAAIRRGEDQDD